MFIFREMKRTPVPAPSRLRVHDPVLGSGVRWRILDLGPFGNEVDQG